MIEKLKSKVTNPYLKDNFTVESIANFFANFISGNNFMSNLEVKEMTELNKAEINDSLKVKNEAKIENLSFSNMNNKVLSINDNEITFDPDAILKMKNSHIAFKVKDVFEVITFMKFIVKICGSKLEKCDFNTLLKNYNSNQMMQILKAYESKLDKAKLVEQEKAKLAQIEADKLKQKNLRKEETMNFKQSKQLFKTESSEKQAEKAKQENTDVLNNDISKDQAFIQKDEVNDDYFKLMENPAVGGLIDSYYYDIADVNNNLMATPQY